MISQNGSKQIQVLGYGPEKADRTLVDGINTQLTKSESQKFNRKVNNRKAYITIIDDDAKADFMTKLKPKFDAHNIKASVAINANFIGQAGYMTWAQIEQLKAEGYEILNHGWEGDSAVNLTVEQMKAKYELEKAAFLAHGLDTYDYYVYSGIQPVGDGDLKSKLQQVYKCCFANSGSPDNYIPFDRYEIKRYASFLGVTSKAQVDFAIENYGYCVLFGHSYDPAYTPELLDEILTYIKSKGVAIEYIQAKPMIDKFVNQIQVGNAGADYFYLDENGNVDFSLKGKSINAIASDVEKLKNQVRFSKAAFSDIPITSYPVNSVTVEPITYAVAQTLGLPDAGLITTVRYYDSNISLFNSFSYQEYNRFGSHDKWIRKWFDTTSRWHLFSPVNDVEVTTAARPRYAQRGLSVFDVTLNLPIWAKTKGYTANKTIARSTAFIKYDVVYVSTQFAYFMCTTAGTTGSSEPTWQAGGNKTTADGTVIWEYVGNATTWINATGTTV